MQNSLNIREVRVKSILSKSKVSDYTLNPYIGCSHGCAYCYARFMKRVLGINERWGEFVIIKVNACELLEREVLRKKKGDVWISGFCDPYQPMEERYQITRKCLNLLIENNFPVTIQTKSPLIIRDVDMLKESSDVEVFMTIATASEDIRKIFEPNAPPIPERLRCIERLNSEGIKTRVMIAPILPGALDLAELLMGKIDYVIIDKMNYHYADWVYRRYNLEWAKENRFFTDVGEKLKKILSNANIKCQLLF